MSKPKTETINWLFSTGTPRVGEKLEMVTIDLSWVPEHYLNWCRDKALVTTTAEQAGDDVGHVWAYIAFIWPKQELKGNAS